MLQRTVFATTRPLLNSRTFTVKTSNKGSFTCDIDAEPLHRYTPGGYHPIHLGDVLAKGRYEVIHKLGWGGYPTVWAARDRKFDRNVAIKINTSARDSATREIQILREIAACNAREDSSHLVRWLDDFEVQGPNGTHMCIVTELLGPSIADLTERNKFRNYQMPARWAKKTAKQLLAAVACLHDKGIGHGDIHTRNLVFKDSKWSHLFEAELLSQLGEPETSKPSSFKIKASGLIPDLRLIDFGEAFTQDSKPKTLHTPLALCAPEVVFDDDWDLRVDLWSAGCAIFELITGQPPFDTIMLTKDILIGQMVDEIGSLPDRWARKWEPEKYDNEGEQHSLEEWLMEVYFYEDREAEFTREELLAWAKALRRLVRFEPAERARAADVLREDCFGG